MRELLAVRAHWTECVSEWVSAWQRGEAPELPAPGYGWNETPKLNAAVVEATRDESLPSIRGRLRDGQGRLLRQVEALSDEELFEVGRFPGAGRYPVARWISLNATRQYVTARTHLRRALREGS